MTEEKAGKAHLRWLFPAMLALLIAIGAAFIVFGILLVFFFDTFKKVFT